MADNTSDILQQIRKAFDDGSDVQKNFMLRKAHDEIERLRDWLREAVADLKFIRDNTDHTVNVEPYEAALGIKADT